MHLREIVQINKYFPHIGAHIHAFYFRYPDLQVTYVTKSCANDVILSPGVSACGFCLFTRTDRLSLMVYTFCTYPIYQLIILIKFAASFKTKFQGYVKAPYSGIFLIFAHDLENFKMGLILSSWAICTPCLIKI